MRAISLVDLCCGVSEGGGGSCGRDSNSADRISSRRRRARDSWSRANPMRRTMRWQMREMPSQISGLIDGEELSLMLLSETLRSLRFSLGKLSTCAVVVLRK